MYLGKHLWVHLRLEPRERIGTLGAFTCEARTFGCERSFDIHELSDVGRVSTRIQQPDNATCAMADNTGTPDAEALQECASNLDQVIKSKVRSSWVGRPS